MGDPLSGPGGVFHASPEPIFNGALWTIRYEVLAYLFAAIGFAVGILRNRWLTIIVLAGSQLIYFLLQNTALATSVPEGIISLFRFTTAFLIGMALWHFPKVRNPAPVALLVTLLAFLLLGWSPLGELLANLLLAACLMKAGLVSRPSARLATMPDYSYGIYIWHYPVLQSVLILNPDIQPSVLLALSSPVILLFSGLSWHIVERPALKLKHWQRLSGRLAE